MAGSSNQSATSARVFISYARADGEDFARKLREDLEAAGIPCWMDRFGMEGGHDWWLQIVEALNQVEFMVLVMTPAAIRSPNVRKEWRYARQQGVCVYPVKAAGGLDYSNLPRWMRSAHFYNRELEWTKLVNDLNTRCEQVRVPFMVEDLPGDFVERPREFEELISKLLDDKREEPVAITAALRGAGGYGKTTIAKALCHDERIQEAFDDGILWVTLGESPGNLVGKVEDLIYMLSREQHNFTGLDAATARFVELLADRDILLVIDDVWNATDLKPFLQGGKKRCARLITTRNDTVLPADAQRIPVDAMQPNEAVQLLSVGLDGGDGSGSSASEVQALQKLAGRLGEWALLLKLANGVLRERVGKYHQSLPDALVYINKALDKRGLTFFDAKDTQDRSQAVAKTLSVSFGLLSADEYARYKELAVFPEDVDIPLATVQKLWGATGGLDDFDTEALCERLHGLSLLLNFDPNPTAHKIRLHDVVRAYLRQEVGMAGIAALDGQLVDAYMLKRWAELPHDELYMWDYLADHLIGAGRVEELVATVKDLRYLATKTLVRNAYAAERDLNAAEKEAPNDVPLRLLKRNFANMSHLLNLCKTHAEVESIVYSRLCHLEELSDMWQALEHELSRPYLIPWLTLPDLPHPALIRTLQGHRGGVNACAVSPLGNYIVSASVDQTLKVWDAHSGQEHLTLRGHTSFVLGCAVSPKGDFIVSASADQTLKVWDARTGQERLTLRGHTDAVNGCAVSPRGDYLVSASEDRTLKVWDAHSGQERLTLRGHTMSVSDCAISPQGNYIVSASGDQTLKVWDARTGQERLTLEGHSGWVHGCAVSPSGDYIVSASYDIRLRVWPVRTGKRRLTLQGHTETVLDCAISPKGDFIVSASADQTLKVWDAHTGQERFTLEGHSGWVRGCAVSPSGDYLVSASDDNTLKVWDTHMRRAQSFILQEHTGIVNSCAISPQGDYVVSASDDQTLKTWDAHTGIARLTLQGHGEPVYGCAVSPRNDYLVSASEDRTLKVWDAHGGQERLTLRGHTDAVNGCAVSPRGDYLVSASSDQTLKVWDARTGAVRFTLRGHTDPVNSCAVSPRGDYLVSASSDETLKVWDARTGAVRFTLRGHTDPVTGCAVSPQGDYLVSASSDQTLKVWDSRTGALRFTLAGHTSWVNGCTVSPQGDYIVSASGDRTLKVWSAQTGECLCTLLVDGILLSCAFHPDGEHIVAGGVGGMYFLRLVR